MICGRRPSWDAPRSASCWRASHGRCRIIFLLAGGPALAAPFAMVTAWPALGGLAARIGHRPGSRGDGNAGGSSGAGVACDQIREPVASDKLGLDRAGASGPCVLLSVRFVSITAIRARRRRWTGSMPTSCGRTIWCSTSAPMSATGWPRSAGWARASSRSSRSRAMVRALRLLYGRGRSVAIEAVAVGRAARQRRAC